MVLQEKKKNKKNKNSAHSICNCHYFLNTGMLERKCAHASLPSGCPSLHQAKEGKLASGVDRGLKGSSGLSRFGVRGTNHPGFFSILECGLLMCPSFLTGRCTEIQRMVATQPPNTSPVDSSCGSEKCSVKRCFPIKFPDHSIFGVGAKEHTTVEDTRDHAQ